MILNAIHCQGHDCYRIDLNGVGSCLVNVYHIYLMKLRAELTNYMLYGDMK